MKRLALSICIATIATPLPANDVRNIPYSKKMADSDIVVIAQASEMRGGVATASVVRILKGRPTQKFRVITDTGIAEMNPDCCRVGATYLMFLRMARDGQFMSVRGKHGIVELGTPEQ